MSDFLVAAGVWFGAAALVALFVGAAIHWLER